IPLVHSDAAIPNVLPLARRDVVVPNLVAGACIHSPNIVRNRKVQNAIYQQRRGLDWRGLVGLERPGKSQTLYVLRSNLIDRTMTSAGIVTVIPRPTVGWRMQKHTLIHPLRQHHAGRCERDECAHSKYKSIQKIHIDWDTRTSRKERARTQRTNARFANTPSGCGCRHLCTY